MPGLKGIFKADAIVKGIEDTFAEGCEKFLAESRREGLSNTASYAAIWGAICFAPGNRKKNWSTRNGSLAMDLRALIVREVIKGTPIRLGSGNRRPLSALSIIKNDNIQKGKNRKAGKDSRGRNLGKRSCSENDAASEAANNLFSATGTKLKAARQRMDDTFFRELGYLYVPWSEARVKLNRNGREYRVAKATLQVDLAKDKEIVWDKFIEEAPSMIVNAEGAGNATNEKALEDMTEKADVCALKIEHEVLVRSNGGVEKGKKTDEINFLTIAHNMVMAYTRCSDSAAFLGSNKNSLRTLIGMAKIQYMLASKVIELGSLEVETVKLSDFMPRTSRKKGILENGCCLKGKLHA